MDNQSTQSRWSRSKPALRILFSILALATGLPCLIRVSTDQKAFLAGDLISIYWIAAADEGLYILGALSLISLWIALVFLSRMPWVDSLLIALLWFIVGCGVLTLLGPQMDGFYTHTDSIRTRNGVYHTGYTSMWWGSCPAIHTGRDACRPAYRYTAIVFQCDSTGLECRAIYHGEEQVISGDRESIPAGSFTRDGSTIRLVIDGQAVWEISNQ
jgi:hypothetical protein